MEYLLPSDIARLVYGYLRDQSCDQAASLFLKTSPFLGECRRLLKKGYYFHTKIMGKSLVEILDAFSEIAFIVSENIQQKDNSVTTFEILSTLRPFISKGVDSQNEICLIKPINRTVSFSPVRETETYENDSNKKINSSIESVSNSNTTNCQAKSGGATGHSDTEAAANHCSSSTDCPVDATNYPVPANQLLSDVTSQSSPGSTSQPSLAPTDHPPLVTTSKKYPPITVAIPPIVSNHPQAAPDITVFSNSCPVVLNTPVVASNNSPANLNSCSVVASNGPPATSNDLPVESNNCPIASNVSPAPPPNDSTASSNSAPVAADPLSISSNHHSSSGAAQPLPMANIVSTLSVPLGMCRTVQSSSVASLICSDPCRIIQSFSLLPQSNILSPSSIFCKPKSSSNIYKVNSSHLRLILPKPPLPDQAIVPESCSPCAKNVVPLNQITDDKCPVKPGARAKLNLRTRKRGRTRREDSLLEDSNSEKTAHEKPQSLLEDQGSRANCFKLPSASPGLCSFLGTGNTGEQVGSQNLDNQFEILNSDSFRGKNCKIVLQRLDPTLFPPNTVPLEGACTRKNSSTNEVTSSLPSCEIVCDNLLIQPQPLSCSRVEGAFENSTKEFDSLKGGVSHVGQNTKSKLKSDSSKSWDYDLRSFIVAAPPQQQPVKSNKKVTKKRKKRNLKRRKSVVKRRRKKVAKTTDKGLSCLLDVCDDETIDCNDVHVKESINLFNSIVSEVEIKAEPCEATTAEEPCAAEPDSDVKRESENTDQSSLSNDKSNNICEGPINNSNDVSLDTNSLGSHVEGIRTSDHEGTSPSKRSGTDLVSTVKEELVSESFELDSSIKNEVDSSPVNKDVSFDFSAGESRELIDEDATTGHPDSLRLGVELNVEKGDINENELITEKCSSLKDQKDECTDMIKKCLKSVTSSLYPKTGGEDASSRSDRGNCYKDGETKKLVNRYNEIKQKRPSDSRHAHRRNSFSSGRSEGRRDPYKLSERNCLKRDNSREKHDSKSSYERLPDSRKSSSTTKSPLNTVSNLSRSLNSKTDKSTHENRKHTSSRRSENFHQLREHSKNEREDSCRDRNARHSQTGNQQESKKLYFLKKTSDRLKSLSDYSKLDVDPSPSENEPPSRPRSGRESDCRRDFVDGNSKSKEGGRHRRSHERHLLLSSRSKRKYSDSRFDSSSEHRAKRRDK